jgi:hypothetical protein
MARIKVGYSTRSRVAGCVVAALLCGSLPATAPAPLPARASAKPAGFAIDVVFEGASDTYGLAKHAYILLIQGSGADPLTYKAEAIGAGKRDKLGIPAGMQALAPRKVPYREQSATAKAAYDMRLDPRRPFDYYMNSFTQSAARVNRAHVAYQPLGDNSNRYAYAALVWAGLHPPATLPRGVWAPGWGQVFSCLSLHECRAG